MADETVKLRLLEPVIHKGLVKEVGDEIEVLKVDAERLIAGRHAEDSADADKRDADAKAASDKAPSK